MSLYNTKAKQILARAVIALFLTMATMPLVTYASVSPQIEVEVVDEGENDTGNATYVPDSNSEEDKIEIPQAAREIINGKDHANDLFGTDQFKVDSKPKGNPAIAKFIIKLAQWTCIGFGYYGLLMLLTDVVVIWVPIVGHLLFTLHLHWWYSDTAAVLSELPVPEKRKLPTLKETPGTKVEKLKYWFQETVFVLILVGVLMAGIATGLVPKLINFIINIIINALYWGMDWLRGL